MKIDTKQRVEDLKRQLEEAKKKLRRWEQQAEKQIKEKPIQSMLIAVGVGALAGAVIATMMRKK
jgi:ElaB/YqjD/DUF883 family membrane-anchored ribosome-binding protein